MVPSPNCNQQQHRQDAEEEQEDNEGFIDSYTDNTGHKDTKIITTTTTMMVESSSNPYLNDNEGRRHRHHDQQQEQQQHSFHDHCDLDDDYDGEHASTSHHKEQTMLTIPSAFSTAVTQTDPPSPTIAEQQEQQQQQQQMAMIERLQEQISFLESKNDAKDQLISDLMDQLQKSELQNKCHTDIDSKLSTFFRATLFNPEEDTVNGDIGSGDDLSTASEVSKSDSSISLAYSAPSIVHTRFLHQPQPQPLPSSLSSSPKFQRPLQSNSDHSLYQNNNSNSNSNSTNIIDQIQRLLFVENGQLRDPQSLLTEYCTYLNNQKVALFDELSVTMSLSYPISNTGGPTSRSTIIVIDVVLVVFKLLYMEMATK